MLKIGTTLVYRLSPDDVRRIREEHATEAIGVRGAHVVGQLLPLVVTRIALDGVGAAPASVNGQVLLDGADAMWITGATEGEDPGQWTAASTQAAVELHALVHDLDAMLDEARTAAFAAKAGVEALENKVAELQASLTALR